MLFTLDLGPETSVLHGRRVSIKTKTLVATPHPRGYLRHMWKVAVSVCVVVERKMTV